MSTILTTCSGRGLDLLAPKPEDIDFDDVAEQLAKENRYNGATRGVAYSVAEHLCRGADAVEDAHGREAAAWFVLHDVPEYVLKDDTTPKKRAMAALAQQKFGVLAGAIIEVYDELTRIWDRAAAGAAGLVYPPPPGIAAIVHRYDRIMLATEWRDLMLCPPPYDLGAETLPFRIRPWPWYAARDALRFRFRALLPVYAAAAKANAPPNLPLEGRSDREAIREGGAS